MRPHDMGTLFDEVAARHTHTTVHLDRPFDIAPAGPAPADRSHGALGDDGFGQGVDYTVPELAGLVREAAGWLHAVGARRGDRVAVVKRNHYDYDLLACAAVRIGAVPALLSGHLSDDALETLLKRLDPAVLVTDRVPPAGVAGRVLALGEPFAGAPR
ncbi:AMP-binding protein, partial [Saccharothrix hoggarensis]